jgi:hypothetical protein
VRNQLRLIHLRESAERRAGAVERKFAPAGKREGEVKFAIQMRCEFEPVEARAGSGVVGEESQGGGTHPLILAYLCSPAIPVTIWPMLLLALLLQPVAFAANDFSRCNGAGLVGDSGHYRITAAGALEYDSKSKNASLLSNKHGKKSDELTFYEFSGKEDRGFRVGQGFGTEGVIRVHATLTKNEGRPVSLTTSDEWFPLDGIRGWAKIKAGLKAGSIKLTKSERTRETESWVSFGYSGMRCFVAQEGETFHKSKLVTFDQALCTRVLTITDSNPAAILKDLRGSESTAKTNAARVLRLIRDAQVATDEKLRTSNQRLQAVELTPPEHQLPGTMNAEDSSALQELRGCLAAQTRNGLERPEASKNNSDFMGDEPLPDLAE